MQFMKMATDCLAAAAAFSGFFVDAAATAIQVHKKRRKRMWTKPWTL